MRREGAKDDPGYFHKKIDRQLQRRGHSCAAIVIVSEVVGLREEIDTSDGAYLVNLLKVEADYSKRFLEYLCAQ